MNDSLKFKLKYNVVMLVIEVIEVIEVVMLSVADYW